MMCFQESRSKLLDWIFTDIHWEYDLPEGTVRITIQIYDWKYFNLKSYHCYMMSCVAHNLRYSLFKKLQRYVAFNALSGVLPRELWNLKNLISL